MSFNWITDRGVIGSVYEGDNCSFDILYTSDDADTELTILSGDLPNGITFSKKSDGHYVVTGLAPSVSQSTIYDFTVRAISGGQEYDRYFTLIVESYDIDWISPTQFAVTTEFAYFSEYFKLRHPNGNEKFVKVSGELPEGLQINSFGLCYGTIGQIEESTDYRFRMGIFVDGEMIIYKDFIITVKTLAELQQPIWITQEGNIGKLNYRNVSNIKLNVYEPNNLPVEFTITEGALPTGLTLNASNGAIEGKVETENQVTWEFTVKCSNGVKEIIREFNIVTNEVEVDDNIEWITDEDLGSVKVGSKYYNQIITHSNYPVEYRVVAGGFPSGIIMSIDGSIYGNCVYQDLKTYSVTIHAKNSKTESLKTFYLKVEKGLGKNAMRGFLYFNLEHREKYSELRSMFRDINSYRSFDKNFAIPYKPEVYIADIACYDKPLLQTLLRYDTYFMLTCGTTKRKIYTETDEEGNEHYLYDVYYKDFKTSNNSPDEEYLEYQSQKHYVKRVGDEWVDYYTEEPVEVVGTVMNEEVKDGMEITYQGMTYQVGYIQEGMYYRTEDKTVVFGNPRIGSELHYNPVTQRYDIYYYYFDGTEKVYVEENNTKRYFDKTNDKVLFDIDASIVSPVYTTKLMYYFRDNNIVYVNIPSIPTIRKRLSTKLYIRELDEDVYYDINNEEILNPKYNKIYDLIWDEEKGMYYFTQDQMPYVQLVAYDPTDGYFERHTRIQDDDTGEHWDRVYIYDGSDFGDIYVKYNHFEVINAETHQVYRNYIFRLEGIKEPFMIDSYGVLRFVNKTDVTERRWYWFDKSLNDIDSEDLALANIYEEDVLDDGQKYIQFFNPNSEILPDWMEGQYFPKMEVFYSTPGDSYSEWQKVLDKEKELDFFNKMDFSFYCVTFNPKYNLDIRPFDIHIDYHSNPYTPHTLIPTHSN